MLLLDGVYLIDEAGQAVFRHVPEPGAQDLQILVEQIAQRIGRTLERCGFIERDMENAWLANFTEAGPLDDLIGTPSPTASPWVPGPVRSCSPCRPCTPDCKGWKATPMAQRPVEDSRCMLAPPVQSRLL